MPLVITHLGECDHIFYDFITTCISDGRRWFFSDIIQSIPKHKHQDFAFFYQQEKYKCHATCSSKNTPITLTFCKQDEPCETCDTNASICTMLTQDNIPYIYQQLEQISFQNVQACLQDTDSCLYITGHHKNLPKHRIVMKFFYQRVHKNIKK